MYLKLSLLLTLSLLLGCEANTPEEYINSGKSFYQQKDYEKAKLEFKNALQIDSQQAEAVYYLALLDIADKKWKQARKNLLKTIEIDSNHIDARIKLAEYSLLGEAVEEGLAQIEKILAIDKHHLEALALKAEILLKSDQIDAAMKMVDNILLKDPSHPRATLLKIKQLKQNNNSQRLVLIDKVLQKHPDHVLFNLFKLELLEKNKDFSAFEQHLLRLIKHSPSQSELSYQLVRYYVRNKKDDQALAVLENNVMQNAELIQPKLMLVSFLSSQYPEQVEQKIKDYIVQTPKEALLYLRLAAFYNAQNKSVEVKNQFNALINNTEDPAVKLNAKIFLAKNETDPIIQATLLNEVLTADNKHHQGLLLKTRLKLKKGLYDEVVIDAREILAQNPQSDQATVLLAQAYQQDGLSELAAESFYAALKLNPSNLFAMRAIVLRLSNKKDFAGAEKVIQTLLKKSSDNIQALRSLTQLKLLQKDWKSAENVVQLIAKAPQGLAMSSYLMGNILLAQNQYKLAIGHYKQALIDSPDLFAALNAMSFSYEKLNQRVLMHDYLKNYIASYPNNPNGLALQAKLFMFDKNWDQALVSLKQGNAQWPKIASFYEGLITVYRQQENQAQIMLTYEQGLKNIPHSRLLAMNLAAIHQQNKAYQQAIALYETVITHFPRDNNAINNLALLLVDYFPTPENLERALELTRGFKNLDNVQLLDTYGWVLLANDQAQQALAVFDQLVAIAPERAVYRYHLAIAHHKLAQRLKAIAELEYALKIKEEKVIFTEKTSAIKLLTSLKRDD
jgi:tetratricopeptide (TPR) repeat protein